ncbi:hypothetical protein C0989_010961, partial [Termitomyces sp. Mn162]
LGDEELGLKLQVIVKDEGVVVVLSDSCHGGASIKELELEEFVEVVVLEAELITDESARGTAINKGGEYLGRVIELDIDDEQPCRS